MIILRNLSDAAQNHAEMVSCLCEALFLGFTSDSDEEIQKVCQRALQHFKNSLFAMRYLTAHPSSTTASTSGRHPVIPRLALPHQPSDTEIALSYSDATTRPPSRASSFTEFVGSPTANPPPLAPHPPLSSNSSFELIDAPPQNAPSTPWPNPEVPMVIHRPDASAEAMHPVGQTRFTEPSTSGESWDECTTPTDSDPSRASNAL